MNSATIRMTSQGKGDAISFAVWFAPATGMWKQLGVFSDGGEAANFVDEMRAENVVDFAAIAAVINGERLAQTPTDDPIHIDINRLTVDNVAIALSRVLWRGNPCFDRVAFLAACGVAQ